MNIPFTLALNVPMMKFATAKNGKGIAIIDTGSECSVFSKSFVDGNYRSLTVSATGEYYEQIGISGKKKKVPIINASTELIFKIGKASVTLKVEGVVSDLSHISEHIKEIIGDEPDIILLGNDFLRSVNAKIDYENKCIVIDNK